MSAVALQAPPESLSEPPATCERCGGRFFPKIMEGVAMLREGLGAIPYRCCACAREVLVSIPGVMVKREVNREYVGLTSEKAKKMAALRYRNTPSPWTDEKIKSFAEMWNGDVPSPVIASRLGITASHAVATYAKRFRVRGYDMKARPRHTGRHTGGRRPGGWKSAGPPR